MHTRNVTFRGPFTGDKVTTEMPVISFNEKAPITELGSWTEHAISDCPLGCKVYRTEKYDAAGQFGFVLMHNSNYGCRR